VSSEGISVVVPVYNSRETLKDLVNRLESVLGSCDGTFEVILVNDGSKDNSWQVIEGPAFVRHDTLLSLLLMTTYNSLLKKFPSCLEN